MRHTAILDVTVHHLLVGQYIRFPLPLFLLYRILHLTRREIASPSDIEITRRRGKLRVDVIPLTSSTELTTLVVILRIENFGWYRVGCVKLLWLQWIDLAGRGVASLYHKVLDNSMEDATIIVATLYPFQKIIPVKRGVIVESHPNVAHRRLQQNLMASGILMYGSCIHTRNSYTLDNLNGVRPSYALRHSIESKYAPNNHP